MSSAPTPRPGPQARPKYYDLNLAHMPPGALASIFHRVSGVILFFPLLPLLLYVLEATLGSEQGYTRWAQFFGRPAVKLIALGFVWAYAQHFYSGLRFLLLDLHWGIDRASGRASARLVFVLAAATTLLVGWRIW